MSRKIQFASLFLIVLLVAFSTGTESGYAQSGFAAAGDPPLNFGNNFFVTGDYVVAGAPGLNLSFGSDGFGTGIISFPDGNPGIRGTTTVPKGATILAALLYWETVEKVGVTPGQPGSGQNGFFRPVFKGGPTKGYPISGVNLPSHNATSFSNGGCSGTSTGKLVRTYRADVRGFLPLDANGNALVDSADGVTFEVRLPNVGNNTPLTLGATLVLIYRVIAPNFPLNVITIYDGAFAPNATPNFTMGQPVQGFYQAGQSGPDGQSPPLFSKLTHIVGAGKSNKFQQAFLSGGQNGIQRAATALPSLYGNGQPAFPGFYTNWDNPTWVFPDPKFPNLANPLHENDDSGNATVVASGANPGCVSWGAMIVSTTVHDDDKDGILPVWKNNTNPGPGYTDVATGQFVSLADVDPPHTGQQDIFIQMDHVVDVDANGHTVPNFDFTPDPNAVSLVKSAFANHNIHLHITDASQTTGITGANAIQVPACTDKPGASPPFYCSYPNQPGITTWRYGFEFIKNQPVNYNTEADCENATNPPCVRRFPIAQRNSHHYVVFGDTLGAANWTFFGGTLTDSLGKTPAKVSQVNNTVTFYTSKGHGLMKDDGTHPPNARVTVFDAITNPNLTGTFFVTGVTCPMNLDQAGHDCDVTNKAAGPYKFTISIPGNPVAADYTRFTDPYLAVASGQAASGSGLSDVGGEGTLVTLGQWRRRGDETLSAKAGTLMHELGHTLGLNLHGGSYFDKLLQNPSDYRQTLEANCKPNYQSVMNYMFQTRLLGSNGVLDFSSQQLSTLNETSLGPVKTTDPLLPLAFLSTDWYDTQQTFVTKNGNRVALGTVATHHCDDTPLNSTDPATYFYQGGTVTLDHLNEIIIPWSNTKLDVNFEGNVPGSEPPFRGYNDWANVDLRQTGATGNSLLGPGGLFPGPGGLFGGPGEFFLGPGPGGLFPGPGGLFPGPGGLWGGPGGLFPGPGGLFPGPGGLWGGPGGLWGGPGELDLLNALSAPTAPSGAFAMVGLSPRTVTLTWTEPNFPATTQNNIYRDSHDGNGFVFIASVAGSAAGTQNTLIDNPPCNPNGYSYEVTAVEQNFAGQNQESTQSNVVSTDQNGNVITACYTNTPPTVLLNDLSFPANTPVVHGGIFPITFSLQADNTNAYPNPFVNNKAVNSLFLIGPYQPNSPGGPCASSAPANTPLITLLTNGVVDPNFSQNGTFSVIGGPNFQFMYGLDSDQLSSGGCYVPKLQLGSGQSETMASPFLLNLDVNDADTPQPTTVALPPGTVGQAYSYTLTQHGGTAPFAWSFTGSLPSGITLGTSTGALSGTTCVAGISNFTAMLTDLKNNSGTRPLTLQINKANTTTGVTSSANPSVFQQMVTFTVTVAPQYSCTPTGTVTLSDGGTAIASNLALTGGIATFTTSDRSVGNHNITASYTGDSNFNASNSAILLQTVNKASTTVAINSVSPSPAVVGQSITVAYTFAVVPPGAGTPIAPAGNVMVAASDGSGCVAAAVVGPGACVLSPAPSTAGGRTFTVTYSGDSNFFGSAANGNYTVYVPTTTIYLSRADYPTGANPDGMTAADFNGDGKLDLAIANSGDNTVTILLGNGDSTFTAKPLLATGAGNAPQLPVAGDFNGDGKLDLAVANFVNGGPSTVSIFLGNGDGTFQALATYPVGNGATSLVTGDFNKDGKLDVAVANQNDHTVSILLGNGDGTFQGHVDYAAGAPDVAGVALGDFNRDGNLDLVVANPSNNTVSVLLGNGDGTFQAPVAYATGNHPVNLAVADLNGDGILDLAVANLNDETVSILLGKGDGTFNPQASYPTTATITIGPVAVTTGDFNGDGKVDLAITNQGDNTVSVLLGNGDGTFQNPLEFPTGSNAAGLAAGDFNGDGRLDVAVADFNANTVSIMLQVQRVLFDGTFNNANWQVTNFTNTTTGVTSGAQVLTGGNPGAYRQITNTVGDAPPGNCVGNVVGFHANAAAIYNPAQQGAITSIDYSEDSILISGGGDGQGGGPALMQGGQVYLGPEHVTPSFNWTHFTNTGLSATDFSAVDQTQFCSAFVNSSQHPDFSTSGLPIQFGFWRANSTSTGGPGYTRIGGIDNWTVVIH